MAVALGAFIVSMSLLGILLLNSIMRKVTVNEHQRGVKFVKGRVTAVLDPGQYWHKQANSRIELVDMRRRFEAVEGQEVLTSDGVSVRVSLAIQYEVADPRAVIVNTESYTRAIYIMVQVALREVITGHSVDDILAKRGDIGAMALELAAPKAAEIGVTLKDVSVRDIMFPGALKQTMGLVVQARKEAEAALERARGEAATMRSLANTARLLDKDPSLMQLRLLQTLAETSGKTVILNFGSQGDNSIPALAKITGESK